jgi:hypothetical protein
LYVLVRTEVVTGDSICSEITSVVEKMSGNRKELTFKEKVEVLIFSEIRSGRKLQKLSYLARIVGTRYGKQCKPF